MPRTKTDRIDIVNGPMIPNIFRFILPLIATSVLQLLYNAADNVVVGRYDSYVALAAVGSTGALINLILNVCIGLSVGSSVAVAQDYGIVPLFQRHSGVFPCAPESVGVHEVQPESLHVFVKIQKIPD